MTKLVRIDEVTYADLVHVTGEMMAKLEKPWSLGMSVRLAVVVLTEIMQSNMWRKIMEELKRKDIPSPEEWMRRFEAQYKVMTSDEGSAGP